MGHSYAPTRSAAAHSMMFSLEASGEGRTATLARRARMSAPAEKDIASRLADQTPIALPVQVEDSPLRNPAQHSQSAAQLDLLFAKLNEELQPLLRPRGPFHGKVRPEMCDKLVRPRHCGQPHWPQCERPVAFSDGHNALDLAGRSVQPSIHLERPRAARCRRQSAAHHRVAAVPPHERLPQPPWPDVNRALTPTFSILLPHPAAPT